VTLFNFTFVVDFVFEFGKELVYASGSMWYIKAMAIVAALFAHIFLFSVM